MLLESKRSQLLVVDIQEKLFPHIDNAETVARNTQVLIAAARELGIPITVSEQYPQGLGPTVRPLTDLLEEARIFEKVEFSCAANPDIRRHVRHLETAEGRDQLVICGMESHICVLQSALGFLHAGHHVAVVMDAVGSRRAESRELALARLLRHEVETVTTEMALFEWMHRAGTDQFRTLSKLIR
ncbi:MAG: hydrolase [Alphaproteobacteria bacterium]|nr:MAG: hydrolase [Alphaproteobacteria bacterium]